MAAPVEIFQTKVTTAADALALINGVFQWAFGPNEPSITFPFLNWADTGTNSWWQRNADDNAWVFKGALDAAFAPMNGWISGLTAVYVSPNQMKIETLNITDRIQQGTKIRYKQGDTWKYDFVSETAFSTDTTLTLMGGSTVEDLPITDFAYSNIANPIGWPFGVTANLVGIVFDSTIPLDDVPGFIPTLGQELVRTDWPIFWSRIQVSGNIVDDETWYNEKRYGSYSYGDGETTFRVPLLVDFVRGWNPSSNVAMGQWVQDTMQNITGYVKAERGTTVKEAGGAFAPLNMSGLYGSLDSSDSLGFDFDASRVARTGEETAPKHVLLPKYIYTGEVW